MSISREFSAGEMAGNRWGAAADTKEFTFIRTGCDGKRQPKEVLSAFLEQLLQDERSAAFDAGPFIEAVQHSDTYCRGFAAGAQTADRRSRRRQSEQGAAGQNAPARPDAAAEVRSPVERAPPPREREVSKALRVLRVQQQTLRIRDAPAGHAGAHE